MIEEKEINEALVNFIDSDEISIKELVVGLINSTYLINDRTENRKYIFQRINSNVFPNVEKLMENALTISEHIDRNLKNNSSKIYYHNFHFYRTKDNKYYFIDKGGFYWRLIEFLENTELDINIDRESIAKEAGRILGVFHFLTNDLKSTDIYEIIEGFHRVDLRFDAFLSTINRNDKRFKETEAFYKEILKYTFLVDIYKELLNSSSLEYRIVHNDPKLSNILFDKERNALCLIDLDTAMPGFLNNDFGDALRTLSNSSNEDEKDLKKVRFNFEVYKSFTTAYLKEVSSFITEKERINLPLFVLLITYEQLIRFYRDFIEYDKYYNINYPKHNLDRAFVQMELLKQMNEKYSEMKEIVV